MREGRCPHPSQELVTPFGQTAAAVFRLLRVCLTRFFQPFDEKLLILLQHQELAQDHVRLQYDTVSGQKGGGRDKILTLSKPLASSRLPSTSPMPASSVTGFSPIGSDTKL